MKFLLPLFLLAASLSAEPDAPNQLTATEKEEGWTLLFDGQTIDHFRNYQKKETNESWEVAEGAMTLTKKGGGDLITKKQYGAFELTLDYKISKRGNSGVMFHVLESEPKPWHTGPEIQIQDNVGGHDPEKAGWLYQLYKPVPLIDATNPAGEWNTLRVLITPEKCVHWMNGKKYVEYVKGSEDWDERVAASKFASKPLFGKATAGHICLQDHGNVVSFRNIKIRDLSQ